MGICVIITFHHDCTGLLPASMVLNKRSSVFVKKRTNDKLIASASFSAHFLNSVHFKWTFLCKGD